MSNNRSARIVPLPPKSEPSPVYPFDRRRDKRHSAAGRVTVVRRTCDEQTHKQPVCSVALRDVSDGGLLATTDVPLNPEESVSVFFPPFGSHRGLDLVGHVVRCLPSGHGYDVAIKFDFKAAA